MYNFPTEAGARLQKSYETGTAEMFPHAVQHITRHIYDIIGEQYPEFVESVNVQQGLPTSADTASSEYLPKDASCTEFIRVYRREWVTFMTDSFVRQKMVAMCSSLYSHSSTTTYFSILYIVTGHQHPTSTCNGPRCRNIPLYCVAHQQRPSG